MLEQIQRYGSIRTQGVTGNANVERIRALSNIGKQVGDIAFTLGAKKRAKEGKIEGAKAGREAAEEGVTPKEREGIFPTFYGEAFDDAQQGAYLASVDRSAIERLNTLENEYANDLEGYHKSANAMLKGLTSSAPDAYKEVIHQSVGNYISRGGMRVNDNILKRGNEEAKSELLGAIDTYSREASRAARNGDFDSVDDLLNKSELSAKAMVSGGFWTKEQADIAVSDARKEIFRQENKRDILETAQTNPEKAIKMLSKLEKKVPESFSPDQWESVVDDIRTDLGRMMPKPRTNREANDWLKKAGESLKHGFKLPESEKAQGAALLIGTDRKDEFDRLMKMEQFSLLPSKQRNTILGQMAGAGTLEAQRDYIALNKIHNNLVNMAKDDGMTLALKQGRIDPAPITEGDISERNAQAEELTRLYGTRVGPYMESEIEGLVATMDEMTPSEKADLAITLDDNERTYQQLDKKNASMFAMMSAKKDKDLAKAVFLGEEMIKTGQFKLPSKGDYSPDINDYLGEVGEVYQVEDRATVIKAALNYYATLGEEQYDDAAMEKALDAITGGIGEINGRKVELPESVGEDDLEDFFDDIQPETLEEFGGLLHPFPMDDIRDGNLVSVGKNRYQLEINGMRQYNKDREPFEIEITPELIMANDQYKPKRDTRGRTVKSRSERR
jgi:hypothetical protein